MWFSTTDFRARLKTNTALRPCAEVVRKMTRTTNGGGGIARCPIWWGERVEKERQFVIWFPDLFATPDNCNVKLQMLELWEILT